MFPYNNSGNRGIGCALNHIQKIADGKPFVDLQGNPEDEIEAWEGDEGDGAPARQYTAEDDLPFGEDPAAGDLPFGDNDSIAAYYKYPSLLIGTRFPHQLLPMGESYFRLDYSRQVFCFPILDSISFTVVPLS